MSGRRYEAIKARIRFVTATGSKHEPKVARASPEYDRLWKIRPVLAAMEEACRRCVTPGRFVTVDEMMVFTRSKWVRVVWPR